MKKLALSIFAIIIPLTLVGNPFNGSDELIIKKENLESFQDMVLHYSGDVKVLYAETPSITLIGYKNCVDNMEATVSSNTLNLRSKSDTNNCIVEVVIEAPEVRDVAVHGGGFVDLTNVSSDTMFVSVYDGGLIRLLAHDFLYAKIINDGEITYVGNPELHTDIVGRGRINRVDPIEYFTHYKATL